MLWCVSINAQTDDTNIILTPKEKLPLDGFKFEFLVGGGETNATEPFDYGPFLSYNIGLTIRKDFLSLLNRKLDMYAIAGCIFTNRGGTSNDDDNNQFRGHEIQTSDISIPVHAGIEYNFKKNSIFLDFGPNLLVRTEKSGYDDLDLSKISTKSQAVGIGFNMGVRFKRFALSIGVDQDLSDFAKLRYEFYLDDKDIIKYKGVKTREFHLNLRWTLGKL